MNSLCRNFFLVLMCVEGLSCSTNQLKTQGDLALTTRPDGEYRLQVGDEIQVKFFLSPELDQDVIVRPDGRISLQ